MEIKWQIRPKNEIQNQTKNEVLFCFDFLKKKIFFTHNSSEITLI